MIENTMKNRKGRSLLEAMEGTKRQGGDGKREDGGRGRGKGWESGKGKAGEGRRRRRREGRKVKAEHSTEDSDSAYRDGVVWLGWTCPAQSFMIGSCDMLMMIFVGNQSRLNLLLLADVVGRVQERFRPNHGGDISVPADQRKRPDEHAARTSATPQHKLSTARALTSLPSA